MIALSRVTRGALQQQSGGKIASRSVTQSLWVDMSNYTGALNDSMLSDLQIAGYVGAVVQAITGNDGHSYTRQQLELLRRWGFRIAGYVWCFHRSTKTSMNRRLAMFDGFDLEFLALDVEEIGLTPLDINQDLRLCDSYTGKQTWIYSGKWYFDLQGWSHHTLWSDRPLWDSMYDNVPDLSSNFIPYGGWHKRKMKQFHGTATIGSLHQVDLNVLDEGNV